MARPKGTDFPDYMFPDGDRGGFILRNPLNGKRKRYPVDQEHKARSDAKKLAEWVSVERAARLLDAGKPTISGAVDDWKSKRMQFMPWDEGTRDAYRFKLNRIRRELGTRYIARTDRVFLNDWLESFCKTADQWNKWRYALVLVWDYAISRKWVEINEAAALQERSTSKKLEMNQKVRQPIDTRGFKAIHECAPGWLKIAMEQSLLTLQGRTEVCKIQYAHYRNGRLFVIRDKTSGDSDMAFIKIEMTPALDELRRRSLLDGILSPYLIHRAPHNQRRDWIEGKPHWTYINPGYLSKAFYAARDAAGCYGHLAPPERPPFHEIRGLGARIQLKRGREEADIQKLMTHSDPKVTDIYLQGGAQALTDDDYIPVSAPLSLREMLETDA